MSYMKPLRVSDEMSIGTFARDWFVVRIRCPCGHEREPRAEYIRRVIGAQATIGEVRRRLRCYKCGGRKAVLEVYQLPRS